MATLLRRNRINFGKTDAKSAMVTRDQESKKLFLNAFAMPRSINLDSIYGGDRYLIYGNKGSGKTALLRFVMESELGKGHRAKFIVFSEDISESEFDIISESVDVESILKPDIGEKINVRDMWSLFLIKNVCDLLPKSKQEFDDHAEIKKNQFLYRGCI